MLFTLCSYIEAWSYGKLFNEKRMGDWIMNWFRRMMAGRYGMDQLGYGLLVGCMLCILLRGICKESAAAFLSILAVVFLGFCYYRIFSHNIPRRQLENQRFLQWWYPIAQWFSGRKGAFAEMQNYKHMKCPHCGQKIRIPRGRGKVSVTCPSCHESFIKKV
ncbi:hypothetical protein D7X25_08530 [bacterium 1XD42-8]|nr:hypothetical protein D7X25_08530 [bacterium 1XD42-8]